MNSQPDQHTTLQLRNDVDALFEMVADLQAWTRRADARFDRIEGDIAELKSDVAGLKTDVAGLKTDVASILRILDERLPAP